MTPLNAIPTDSISWLIGTVAILILGVKSLLRYHRSRDELTKYITWFALVMGVTLATFCVPSLFTLNTRTILIWDLIGEGLFYGGMMAQTAIMWFLILRPRFSVYFATVPVGVVGLAAWLYALPYTKVLLANNFIYFLNPRFPSLVTAVLLIGLFGPVGVYFLRVAPGQAGFKAIFTSVAVGLTYLGIGLIGGGFEIVTSQMMTPGSVVSFGIFFSVLLVSAVWPRRANARPPLQLPNPSS